VHFGYAQYGWVALSLLGGGVWTKAVVSLSHVYDPFDDLLAWLHSVADGALPAVLTINEEGSRQRLEVRSYTGRYAADSDIEFRVTELDGGGLDLPGTPCRMLLRTTRAQLLQEFTHRLAAWLQHDYVADDWSRVDPDNCEDAAEFADVCRRVDLRQCLDMAGLLQRVPLKAR
jgi:hypothetical protein